MSAVFFWFTLGVVVTYFVGVKYVDTARADLASIRSQIARLKELSDAHEVRSAKLAERCAALQKEVDSVSSSQTLNLTAPRLAPNVTPSEFEKFARHRLEHLTVAYGALQLMYSTMVEENADLRIKIMERIAAEDRSADTEDELLVEMDLLKHDVSVLKNVRLDLEELVFDDDAKTLRAQIRFIRTSDNGRTAVAITPSIVIQANRDTAKFDVAQLSRVDDPVAQPPLDLLAGPTDL